MIDFTPALAREHSATIDRETCAAAEQQFRRQEIAESVVSAWMRGQWQEHIQCFNRIDPLASVVVEDLCNLPDNPLFSILYIVRDAAYAGDKRAIELIKRMAEEHAQKTVELSQ